MVRALGSRVGVREGQFVFNAVLFAYVLFSLLDWLTTTTALARGLHERNPLAASLYAQYGPTGLLAFKALIVGVIIAVLVLIPRRIMSTRVAVWVATAFCLITALTDIGNVQALQHLPLPRGDLHQLLPSNVRFF